MTGSRSQEDDESVIERLRDSGVGTEDPNIAPDETPHVEQVEPGDEGTVQS